MANERDFELLDDYLTDRIDEADRSAIEQRLNADPDLQHEYAIQKHLIQGIKNARAAELKAMLNNVQIPSGNSGGTLGTKILLGTATAFIVIAAVYWLMADKPVSQVKTPAPENHAEEMIEPIGTPDEPAIQPEPKADENSTPTSKPETAVIENIQADKKVQVDTDKNQTSAGTEHSKPSLGSRPGSLSAPAVPAPSRQEPGPDERLTPAKSTVSVETDRNDSRYAFHYQLRDGKLVLYGPFEPNSYRVMEFNTDSGRVVFLMHNSSYYQLRDDGALVKPLTPVQDAELIRRMN